MNKEQYTDWMKNGTISTILSVASEIEKYPYCMPFHLIRTMKANTAENKSVLAVLHPNRTRLQTILLQGFTNIKKEKTSADSQDKIALMDILQKRLTELNESSNEEKEEISAAEYPIYEPQSSVSLDELVEKFNKIPPKVSFNPDDFEGGQQYKDLGKSSVFERMNIISETLAELYLKQGAYDKALKIYEALKSKYPEKSVTFAKIIKSINDKKK